MSSNVQQQRDCTTYDINISIMYKIFTYTTLTSQPVIHHMSMSYPLHYTRYLYGYWNDIKCLAAESLKAMHVTKHCNSTYYCKPSSKL